MGAGPHARCRPRGLDPQNESPGLGALLHGELTGCLFLFTRSNDSVVSSCLKLVASGLVLLAPFVAFPQGQIIFDNRVSATVIAPVYDSDPAHPETAKQGNTAQGIPVGTQT